MKLILLPGMDGTGALFVPFIAALQGEFDTLVVCYPRQRVLSYVELERLVRSELPDSEPFVLVAESFSSPVAIRLAVSAPENLKGVVLCAGFISSPLQGLKRLAALALAPIVFRFSPPSRVLRWFLIGRNDEQSLVNSIRATLSDVKSRVLAARLRFVLNCDERTNLRRLELPILFLRPTQDQVIPDASFQEICATNPGVEMVEVQGPHLILQTRPKQCSEVIAAFVRLKALPRTSVAGRR